MRRDLTAAVLDRDYWDGAAKRNPFNTVRTGWSEADFDTRTNECLGATLKLKPTDVVLDYGCGPSYGCKLVAPKVSRYVGIDYSDEMLNVARRRNGSFANAVFVKGDGLTIPFPDCTFDCVYCELVFQHLARADTLHILAEMQRTMKPNARFAIQVPGMIYGSKVGFTTAELESRYPGWDVSRTEYYVYLTDHAASNRRDQLSANAHVPTRRA